MEFGEIDAGHQEASSGVGGFEQQEIAQQRYPPSGGGPLLPEGKVLIPGVISHATPIVEHPRLVAQRLVRFAERVGRANVLADCGKSETITP